MLNREDVRTFVGWTPEEWAEIERAAQKRGISAEQYVINAVREKLADVPDVMEPLFHHACMTQRDGTFS